MRYVATWVVSGTNEEGIAYGNSEEEVYIAAYGKAYGPVYGSYRVCMIEDDEEEEENDE